MKLSRRARPAAFAAALAIIATPATPATAGQRIVNGLKTQDFPTTGALLYSGGAAIDEDNAGSQCTGTLVGCSTFLTAAHCVEEDTAPSHYLVYLQHGGLHEVSSVTVHPSYSGASGNDLAVLELASPVEGIDPTTLNTTHDLEVIGPGVAGTIAGFGRTGGGSDYGVKRYGAIVTATCDTGATGGEGDDVLVCWDYDASVGAPGTDSNTCNGDSGGPLFIDFSGSVELAGVTSAGVVTNCGPGDHSWDASVYANRTWILGQLGADSTAACGAIPAVGSVDVQEQRDTGTLGLANVDDSLSVVLSGSPSLVRFTLNGTDNGSFSVDFFVKQGAGASAAAFDCKADGSSNFGACEFVAPADGTWSVFVRRNNGAGDYQVTTTVFGGDPPVCGNGAAEYGEQCDGADDDACPGECEAGCTCTVPFCGDGSTDPGEQCDGADDAACPGQCQAGCACPSSCTASDLYGLQIVSDEARLRYKAWLFDDSGAKAGLDPRDGEFALEITDGSGTTGVSVPAGDPGWTQADTVRRKFGWKGDGSLGGLRRVKLKHRDDSRGQYWKVDVRGVAVPGGADVDVSQVLDFRLDFDGTCHVETW